MSVREPCPLVPCVPQALMTAPPQTANDREGRWHRSKLKAQHCVRPPLVPFIFLWETAPHLAPSASLLPHLLAHFDPQSGARSVFYWRNCNQWAWSSKQAYVRVEMFALGNGRCCVFIWGQKSQQGCRHCWMLSWYQNTLFKLLSRVTSQI